MIVILHSVDPGSAAREALCRPPPRNAAAVQRCTAALPHNHSDHKHGKDLLQPTQRWAAQPSQHLAGSSSP